MITTSPQQRPSPVNTAYSRSHSTVPGESRQPPSSVHPVNHRPRPVTPVELRQQPPPSVHAAYRRPQPAAHVKSRRRPSSSVHARSHHPEPAAHVEVQRSPSPVHPAFRRPQPVALDKMEQQQRLPILPPEVLWHIIEMSRSYKVFTALQGEGGVCEPTEKESKHLLSFLKISNKCPNKTWKSTLKLWTDPSVDFHVMSYSKLKRYELFDPAEGKHQIPNSNIVFVSCAHEDVFLLRSYDENVIREISMLKGEMLEHVTMSDVSDNRYNRDSKYRFDALREGQHDVGDFLKALRSVIVDYRTNFFVTCSKDQKNIVDYYLERLNLDENTRCFVFEYSKTKSSLNIGTHCGNHNVTGGVICTKQKVYSVKNEFVERLVICASNV